MGLATFKQAVCEILFARKCGVIQADEMESLLFSIMETSRVSNAARKLLCGSKYVKADQIYADELEAAGLSPETVMALQLVDEAYNEPGSIGQWVPSVFPAVG